MVRVHGFHKLSVNTVKFVQVDFLNIIIVKKYIYVFPVITHLWKCTCLSSISHLVLHAAQPLYFGSPLIHLEIGCFLCCHHTNWGKENQFMYVNGLFKHSVCSNSLCINVPVISVNSTDRMAHSL